MGVDRASIGLKNAPWQKVNIFSRLTWAWVGSLLTLGSNRPLEMEDLHSLGDEQTSEYLFEEFKLHRQDSLTKTLWSLFGNKILLNHLLEWFYWSMRVAQALLLKEIVNFLGTDESVGTASPWKGYVYAISLGLLAILQGVVHHQFFFNSNLIGSHIRIVLNGAIFEKMTSLKSSALVETTLGQIVNLISNDAFKFEQSIAFWPFTWMAPVLMGIVLWIMYWEIGSSAIAGMALFLFLNILQIKLGKNFAKIRVKTAKHTDERVKVVKEVLAGAEVVKMNCWESSLEKVITKVREDEVHSLRQAALLKGFNLGSFFLVVLLPSCLMFAVEVWRGNQLEAGTIFTIFALLESLKLPVGQFFWLGVQGISEARIAVRRIERFLNLSGNKAMTIGDASGSSDIVIKNGNFSYGSHLPLVLKNIDLSIPHGELVLVFGAIGSSKSSLLLALMEELECSEDTTMNVARPMAYASQKSWIFAGSLRDNIVFKRPFDKELYNNVLRVCQLESDIQLLPNGDATVIGERGVNLSGGQKARVALARAVYSQARVILLDDPLSAVDALVGEKLVKQCLGEFLSGQTRILVTHQTQFMSSADRIIYLENGVIRFNGTPSALIHQKELWDSIRVMEETEAGTSLQVEEQLVIHSKAEDDYSIFVKEDRVQGRVGFRAYKALESGVGGLPVVILLFVLIVSANTCSLLSDWHLTNVWADKSLADQNDATNFVYQGLLVLATTVFSYTRVILSLLLMLKAVSVLHKNMFSSVLYSPMRFFESNPLGRIVNRFAKDQAVVDELLPIALIDACMAFLQCLSAIVIVSIAIPIALVSIVFVFPIFVWHAKHYLMSSRELKRLDAISKSPVFSFFSASLDGRSTVRAFNLQDSFLDDFHHLIDANSRSWFGFQFASRWIGFRMDLISGAVVLFAGIFAVVLRESLTPTLVGLSLTYIIRLSAALQWSVRQSVEAENFMTSVERIDSYGNLEPENPNGVPAPKDWPSQGGVSIRDLKLRYRPELPLVLKGLTVDIKPREKIGVCGRTGAGKSSLFMALFRLVESESGNGSGIFIDGVDISTLKLSDLRSSFAVIPQEPTIFSGTIRYNLDPFDLHSDDEIWSVLDMVQLRDLVEKSSHGLESLVAEYGGSLSVGEGQLLCVARALLKPSKLLFVDEGTASVDKKTDQLIQKILREKFKNRTVLTIAHRLDTIMDCDRIIVMDQGKAAEIGSAKELLAIPNGIFANMVQMSN